MERENLVLNLPVAGQALERIVTGYFKVAIISTALSTLQHHSITSLAAGGAALMRTEQGILMAALYPLYLYFNFLGYTDVVIGVARFLRIELPENFDRPFLSENVIIFWNRWHMTLSGWLKRYVYNPFMLTAMRRITSPALAPYVAVTAFFITFFLVGLWHGQTSAFIIFGLLTGGGVAANKLWQLVMQKRLGRNSYRSLAANPLYRACCRGLNFTWFAFTLMWFWSDGTHLLGFCRALGTGPVLLVWLAIFAIATLGLAAWDQASRAVLEIGGAGEPIVRSRYLRTMSVTAVLIVMVGIITLLNAPAPDIVYKAF
jgi:D-alanyl-lipoteichoic acid acyltransferase DltB (MBOAT superfamily)